MWRPMALGPHDSICFSNLYTEVAWAKWWPVSGIYIGCYLLHHQIDTLKPTLCIHWVKNKFLNKILKNMIISLNETIWARPLSSIESGLARIDRISESIITNLYFGEQHCSTTVTFFLMGIVKVLRVKLQQQANIHTILLLILFKYCSLIHLKTFYNNLQWLKIQHVLRVKWT